MDAVEGGPNKQVDKRILVNQLVEGDGKKGYRINMSSSVINDLHQREYIKSKKDIQEGIPELVYLAQTFGGNKTLLEEAASLSYGSM